MKKSNFQKLKGNDLDKLLNQAFLKDLGEAGNDAMLESISNRVMFKQNIGFLFSTQVFFNKFFFAIAILSFTGSAFTWWHSKGLSSTSAVNGVKATNTMPMVSAEKELVAKEIIQEKAKPEKRNIPVPKINTPQAKPVVAVQVQPDPFSTDDPADNVSSSVPVEMDKKTVQNTEPQTSSDKSTPLSVRYMFPNLTQKQIKDNENEKKWMAKFAAKLKQDKGIEKYVKIPASADKTVAGFYMASGEITNLNYRTFLFDLLINERKEEFLVAKPQQSLWQNAGGVNWFDTLSASYFSDQKYDDYPVVNIPVAGAELYCEWLTKLTNEIREKEGKPSIEVRLPYEKEWMYAATVGRAEAVYPWFTDSIQDDKNRFLANFCIKKQAGKFKQPVIYLDGFDPNAYTSAGMASNNFRNATFVTWSYEPNGFQLYNLCGNVSEMVYTDSKKVKTKGGNWNSDFEHLKLNSEDEFKDGVKPCPMIGFRVCIIEKK